MYDRILLFPYFLTLKVRDNLYKNGTLKSACPVTPTVCIGNITVGGTGKTPHTEMVLEMLRESGYGRVAMLSRGYGRRGKGFRIVEADDSAMLCGDEPLQVKKNVPQALVAVCRDRLEGCARLRDEADVIVLDDAFQYRKLRAKVNIVMVDWHRPVTEDRLLPIGRLRDLPERLHDADAVIVSKCPAGLEDEEREAFIRRLGLEAWKDNVFFTTIGYRSPEPVFAEGDRHFLYSDRAILVSGIANDTPLRQYLSDSYRLVEQFHFPDHHRFTQRDIERVGEAARRHGTATIITTQKDAQRMADIQKVPDILKSRTFYAPITAEFFTPQERESFRNFLLGALR